MRRQVILVGKVKHTLYNFEINMIYYFINFVLNATDKRNDSLHNTASQSPPPPSFGSRSPAIECYSRTSHCKPYVKKYDYDNNCAIVRRYNRNLTSVWLNCFKSNSNEVSFLAVTSQHGGLILILITLYNSGVKFVYLHRR